MKPPMTKPNELTPEQAIERVEAMLAEVDWYIEQDTPFPSTTLDANRQKAEALRIVLELAKRPYALGEEEREALSWMRDDLYKVVDEIPTPKVPKVVRLAALTAALNLEQPPPLLRLDSDGSVTELKPEEPFTVEKLQALREKLKRLPQNSITAVERPVFDFLLECRDLLDAMLAQSSPANS